MPLRALQVTCFSQINSCSHTFLLHPLSSSRNFGCRIPCDLFSGSYLPLFNQIPKSWFLPSLDCLPKYPIIHPLIILSQMSQNRFGSSKEGPERWFLHTFMRKMEPGVHFPNIRQQADDRTRVTMQTAPLSVCEVLPSRLCRKKTQNTATTHPWAGAWDSEFPRGEISFSYPLLIEFFHLLKKLWLILGKYVLVTFYNSCPSVNVNPDLNISMK